MLDSGDTPSKKADDSIKIADNEARQLIKKVSSGESLVGFT